MGRVLLTVPVLLVLAACEPAPEVAPEGVSPADEAAAAAREALAETIRRADSAAAAIEDRLRPVPLQRPAEEAALRRYLAGVHVPRARQLGVQASGQEEIDALIEEGRLVQLEDSTRHWIVRATSAPAYVVPHTRALLEELGERFQARLAEMDLPPYRFEITSTLRTAAGQARLRSSNVNAAAGVSAHQFGTTVDIPYSAYAPPAEIPETLRVDAPEALRPHLDRIANLALESVSARKSRELTKILGDVLRQAQGDGLVLVTFERLQPVYHVTVARALAD
ncbi:MAG: hypothetical protein KY453_01430 [Gemmatimonadetes bacterium]|nr:hypothetical protein [Gemmatimonadota bacterium]